MKTMLCVQSWWIFISLTCYISFLSGKPALKSLFPCLCHSINLLAGINFLLCASSRKNFLYIKILDLLLLRVVSKISMDLKLKFSSCCLTMQFFCLVESFFDLIMMALLQEVVNDDIILNWNLLENSKSFYAFT